MLACLARALLPPEIDTVIAGHTHRPGQARVGRYRYFNAGTWSEHMATAVSWQDGDGAVVDVLRAVVAGHARQPEHARRQA